jgi:hypothetical protein
MGALVAIGRNYSEGSLNVYDCEICPECRLQGMLGQEGAAQLKILYHGPLWSGSTSLQRARSLARQPDVTVIEHDTHSRPGATPLWQRIRWRLGVPDDTNRENDRLLAAVRDHRPDVVLVDSSRVLTISTLRRIRGENRVALAFYTPDDIMARHNFSYALRASFPEWDVFYTTKTFNIDELRRAGVRRPVLVGKAYDPDLHRPRTSTEIGPDFERFDLVFIGAFESERCRSINSLSEAGMSIVVYGASVGGWKRSQLRPGVDLRPSAFNEQYVAAMHHGRIALCFLRKASRDRITQRTMEIAAMGRPMLAEKTTEHDDHFIDGHEYIGFMSDSDLVEQASRLLAQPEARHALGMAARKRCLISGYSTDARAGQMVQSLAEVISRMSR